MGHKEVNLFKALGLFIEEMRSVFHGICLRKFGANWESNYSASFLHDTTKTIWDKNIQKGEKPEDLIDFGNLWQFANEYAESQFLIDKFPGGVNFKLSTYFKDISEARNRLMHFLPLKKNKIQMAYSNMIEISEALGKDNLKDQIDHLYEKSFGHRAEVNNKTKSSQVSEKNNKTKSDGSSTKLKKSEAIAIVNNCIAENTLTGTNTIFANISEGKLFWWLNIPPRKFEKPLNLLLVEGEEIIRILLPEDKYVPAANHFKIRDNGKADIYISTEGNDYLKDTKFIGNPVDFRPYVKERINWPSQLN